MVLLDHHLPSFQWELRLVEQTGVPLQRIRFMVSCFASVALSLGWRFVPTPKGIIAIFFFLFSLFFQPRPRLLSSLSLSLSLSLSCLATHVPIPSSPLPHPP